MNTLVTLATDSPPVHHQFASDSAISIHDLYSRRFDFFASDSMFSQELHPLDYVLFIQSL